MPLPEEKEFNPYDMGFLQGSLVIFVSLPEQPHVDEKGLNYQYTLVFDPNDAEKTKRLIVRPRGVSPYIPNPPDPRFHQCLMWDPRREGQSWDDFNTEAFKRIENGEH